MTRTSDVVICGAGIAGIATAHALARHGVRHITLVDDRSPMTLTSDKSTEAYRNWWPGPDDAMVRFMNRSIDLLEQWADHSNDRFLLNRRGYVYATTDPARAEQYITDAQLASAQGAGDLRVYRDASDAQSYQPSAHTGYRDHPTGADLFLDRASIRAHFPWLADDIVAVLHTRRCGWMSGQQLGMYLLDEARAMGVAFLAGRLERVEVVGGRVTSVHIAGADATAVEIATPVLINCAGPFAKQVAALIDVELPLFSEMHLKVAFEDTLGVVDRDTGLVILDDAQTLPWSDDERSDLASSDETRWLTEPMPAGIHLRPEGYRSNQTVLMLWDYHSAHRFDLPELPLPDDPFYPEVVMRGMVRLAPGLARYLDRLPPVYVDGGYYTKTIENRPLIGPLPVAGAYVNAALSGYGLMAAPAAGELLAAQVTGAVAPTYASAFALERYRDPAYQALLANWGSTGQL
ncbi:MAG: FAD-dependent oxidoreductase [Gemmatimonadaceae bacterium]|nr:FAD-dependent oxidoreductase [Gemmatimonadaceae bacterium]